MSRIFAASLVAAGFLAAGFASLGAAFEAMPALPLPVMAAAPEWQWQWSNPMPTGNNLIQIAFTRSKQGVIVADNGEVLRSSDGGQNWRSSGGGLAKRRFVAATVRDDFMLAVGSDGRLWKQTSAGKFWRVTDSLATALYDVCGCGDAAFLAVGKDGLILRSTDRGESWKAMRQVPDGAYLIGLHCDSTGLAVAVGDTGLTLRSRDFGQTWERLIPPLAEMLTGTAFADAQRGTVVTEMGKVATTRDGGLTWNVHLLDSLYFLRHILWHDNQITVSGSDGGVWTSNDDGATWSPKVAPTFNFIGASALNPSGEEILVGNAGILLRQRNARDALQALSKGSLNEVQGLVKLSPKTWLAYGAEGLILKTQDGGTTWREQTGHDRYLAGSFRGRRGLLVGYDGTLIRSEDEGETWQPGSIPPLEGPLYGVAWSDTDKAIAVGVGGTFWRSVDAGKTWQNMPPQPEITDQSLSAVTFKPDGTGFIAGYRGTLLRSADGGATWASVALPTQNHLYALSFRDNQVGMAVGARGLVLITRDGGHSWQPESTGVADDYLFSALWLGGDTALVSGAWGHSAIVRMTPDAGKTWSTVSVPTSSLVYSITPLGQGRIAAVGSRGLILIGQWGSLSSPQPATPPPTDGGFFSVQRSGLPGLARLQFDQPFAAQVTVSALALDGRYSKTLYRGRLDAGRHRLHLAYPPQRGPLLFRLEADEKKGDEKPLRLRRHAWLTP